MFEIDVLSEKDLANMQRSLMFLLGLKPDGETDEPPLFEDNRVSLFMYDCGKQALKEINRNENERYEIMFNLIKILESTGDDSLSEFCIFLHDISDTNDMDKIRIALNDCVMWLMNTMQAWTQHAENRKHGEFVIIVLHLNEYTYENGFQIRKVEPHLHVVYASNPTNRDRLVKWLHALLGEKNPRNASDEKQDDETGLLKNLFGDDGKSKTDSEASTPSAKRSSQLKNRNKTED